MTVKETAALAERTLRPLGAWSDAWPDSCSDNRVTLVVGRGVERRARVAGRSESAVLAPAPVVRSQPGDRPVPAEGPVLVIDDEAPLRLLLRDDLEAEGFEVVTAGNGPEALDPKIRSTMKRPQNSSSSSPTICLAIAVTEVPRSM